MKQKFNHWLPKLINADAIVLYPFVLFAEPQERVSDRLYRHEYMHVEQVGRVGWLRFYISYIFYWLAGWSSGMTKFDAYMAIPYEREAREAEEAVNTNYLPLTTAPSIAPQVNAERLAMSPMKPLTEPIEEVKRVREAGTFLIGDMVTCADCGNLQLTCRVAMRPGHRLMHTDFVPVIQLRKLYHNPNLWNWSSYCCRTPILKNGRLHTPDGWV